MPEIRVEWLFPDGQGGAPLKKQGIVRLPGTLPGDLVEYREVSRRGSTAIAEVLAIIEPSPHRTPPTCRFDAHCGGCDLSEFQTTARRDALARIAQQAFHLDHPPAFEADRGLGRARIKLSLDQGNLGYRAERSHDLVAVDDCEVARPEVRSALERLLHWATPARLKGCTAVEIRSNGERAIFAVSTNEKPHVDGSELTDVAINGRPIHGDPTLQLSVADLTLRCSPSSFYQVNLEMNAVLLDAVRRWVRKLQPERLLELYCGIGNLTLPLARDGWKISAVEREGESVADLRWSAAQAKLQVDVVAKPAEKFDPSLVAFDVALLDPPRAGAPGIIEKLLLNRPKAIVYVSCDAPSAARDLQAAWKAGYQLEHVECFDMFPKTRHFETLIIATRKR